MKKKLISLALAGAMVMSLAACGGKDSGNAPASGSAAAGTEAAAGAETKAETAAGAEKPGMGLANPWREITYEEANKTVAKLFKIPDGATNTKWSMMDAADPSAVPGPVVQLDFDLDGLSFTAREQVTGDNPADISGMYYDWTVTDEGTLSNWAGGEMKAKFYRYVGDNEYADLCTWYDVEYGASYSLGTVAKDLDGFDIQAVAEAMYDPSTQPEGTVPDEPDVSGETGNPGVPVTPDDHKPVDISGCDTFTQILDKLPEGYYYANANIKGRDVFLVTEYTYEYEQWLHAAIDADIFTYDKDGILTYCGYVTAGGTAYPLMLTKDGCLFVAGNHFASHYIISDDNKAVIDEEAYVEYQSDGTGKYYLYSDTHPDMNGETKDDSGMTEMYAEMDSAEIISFEAVK